MDWALAVEKNRVALTRIVAEIVALVGFVAGEQVQRLPRGVYLAASRMLLPAESALRRLIIIAARGLVVKPSVSKPFPKGKVIAAATKERISFRLCDSRKRFDFITVGNPLVVKVKTYTNNPFNPFQPNPWARPEPAPRDDTLNLTRRLAAVKQALENLPQQAIRMARWQAKRKSMIKPKFTSPLRPGRPPGYRGEAESKIDFLLQETHGLANDALRVDSS
jgi:hypothetical protein